MAETSQVISDDLLKEVRTKAGRELYLARWSHWLNVSFMVMTVAATVFAVVWGIQNHSGKSTAIAALIPGAIALLAGNLKFEARCNWHYKRYYALEALRRRLELKLAQPPANPEVAEFSENLTNWICTWKLRGNIPSH